MRPAVDLTSRDDNDCAVYTAAMILYTTGVTPKPDPNMINRKVGRRSGQTLEAYTDTFLLLDSGLHVQEVGTTEGRPEEFVKTGLPELKRLINAKGQKWGPAYDRYWTPERVARVQQLTAEYLKRESSTNKRQMSRVECLLTEKVIRRLLAERKVLNATLLHSNLSNGANCHKILIYGVNDDGTFQIYSPKATRPTLHDHSWSQLQRMGLDSSVDAWWRP